MSFGLAKSRPEHWSEFATPSVHFNVGMFETVSFHRALHQLQKNAPVESTHILSFSFTGSGTATVLSQFTERFGTPARIEYHASGAPTSFSWLTASSLVMLRTSLTEEKASVYIGSINTDDTEWAHKKFYVVGGSDGTSPVYTVRKSEGELIVNHQGYMGMSLQPLNYTPEIVRGFENAVADFRSPHPAGRIVLLDGPPGTGKTFLIRAFMGALSPDYETADDNTDCSFVIVNASLSDDLQDAAFMTALEDSDALSGTCILVLEDADKLLQPREKGVSLGGLSSLLNLGDGLLGDLIDIRLIATTNSPFDKLDPAITRAGRLSERLHIDKLPQQRALELLQSLLPDNEDAHTQFVQSQGESIVLADVYEFAREHGWNPSRKK